MEVGGKAFGCWRFEVGGKGWKLRRWEGRKMGLRPLEERFALGWRQKRKKVRRWEGEKIGPAAVGG